MGKVDPMRRDRVAVFATLFLIGTVFGMKSTFSFNH